MNPESEALPKQLEAEARLFFADAPDDREERLAFQKANLKTWTHSDPRTKGP
jgi:hypothetical protein